MQVGDATDSALQAGATSRQVQESSQHARVLLNKAGDAQRVRGLDELECMGLDVLLYSLSAKLPAQPVWLYLIGLPGCCMVFA